MRAPYPALPPSEYLCRLGRYYGPFRKTLCAIKVDGADIVVVVAVLHASRDPAEWQRRKANSPHANARSPHAETKGGDEGDSALPRSPQRKAGDPRLKEIMCYKGG